jgi:hypothetical protein
MERKLEKNKKEQLIFLLLTTAKKQKLFFKKIVNITFSKCLYILQVTTKQPTNKLKNPLKIYR